MMRRRHVPIIVGGSHRSGTSLVRRLLNAHPRIHCGPEVKFFRDFYGHYRVDPLAHLRFSHSARTLVPESELLAEWGRLYVRLQRRAAQRAGKTRWADKNPENAVYLPQWEQLLGQRWLYVHVIRNPLDALASIDEAGFPQTLPPDWPGRIAYVRRYMELGLEYVERHPDRAHLVVYEQLVSRPAPTLTALMRFLGETYRPGQLDFNRQDHGPGIEDPKIKDAEGIHGHSVGRWRGHLDDKTARMIWQATEGLWQAVDPGGQWASGPEEMDTRANRRLS